jgi:hypothetical protein
MLQGGFSAAMTSIRHGKAEMLARFVLAGFSGMAIVAALVLGIGVNSTFGDAVLRRYPLSPGGRFLTRRLMGFLDPLWTVLFALYMGVAAGFHAAGVGSIWLATPAVLLLVIATYLCAQLLTGVIGWMSATSNGLMSLAMLVIVLLVAIAGIPAIEGTLNMSDRLLVVMRFTPAFWAARVMANSSMLGLVFLLAWCLQ